MKTAVFDARSILTKPSGIGVYARELALRLPGLLPGYRFVFLCCAPSVRDDLLAALPDSVRDRCTVHTLPYSFGSVKNQLLLPRELKRLKADVFHMPNFFLPLAGFRLGKRPYLISTIHDVIPILLKDFAPGSKTAKLMWCFRWFLRQCATRSDVVVTVSERSRLDILSTLSLTGKQAGKVHAVHNGVQPVFRAEEHAPVKTDASTPRELLYVGRMDPYKNVPALVRAFHLARKRCPVPLRLNIVGPLDPRFPEAQEEAKRCGEEEFVNFTGSVPFEELLRRYRTSDVLVHPAKYEGFGLQLAEAMASGLPVICTDGGSAPEVVGDAAVVVPLASGEEAFAQAIADVCSQPQRQASLRSSGLLRSQRFTWEQAALEISKFYP